MAAYLRINKTANQKAVLIQCISAEAEDRYEESLVYYSDQFHLTHKQT